MALSYFPQLSLNKFSPVFFLVIFADDTMFVSIITFHDVVAALLPVNMTDRERDKTGANQYFPNWLLIKSWRNVKIYSHPLK